MADLEEPHCTRSLPRTARAGAAALALSCLSLGACQPSEPASTDTADASTTDDATTGGTATTEAEAGSSTDAPTTSGGTTGAEIPADCDAYVTPGDDDQTALQGALLDAADGDTVCLAAGTFALNGEVSISANALTLKGAGRDATILDFSAQDLGANGVKITGDGVTVTGFTVRDTPGDGIRGDEVDGITYDDVVVEWSMPMSMENGAYGFYPVGCDAVTIRNSKVVGARDAGIYVGQSTNILVEDNEAHGNVAGIEIENSTGATVRRNHTYDNTAGILIFNLPGLPVQDGKRTLAYENIVENNNVPNFGVEGTVVAEVPAGIGFMILASDYNELRDNTIRGNNSAGVVIVSYSEALFEPHMDATFDEYAEGNYIHHNAFEGNGEDPDAMIGAVAGIPTPDVIDDGCEDPDKVAMMQETPVNCLFENGDADWIDFDLCGGLENKNSDLASVTCEYPELPELPGG